ncbi:MAG TPA: hypothetical protein VNA68_02250 [Candidatus Dormibacteraeota bacterium]|nr:hypothetical protein [Candidatus Dormibacteraeota bacterium]
MSVSIQAKIVISSKPKEVFKYLQNADCHTLWSTVITHVSAVGELKVNQVYDSTGYPLGKKIKSTNRVTKLLAGKEFEVKSEAGPLAYTVNYQVSETKKNCTNLICNCKIEANVKIFNMAEPIFKYMAYNRIKSDLNNIKILAENPK